MAKGKKKMTTHKNVRSDRPSGKSLKQHPQVFHPVKRRLVTGTHTKVNNEYRVIL